MHDEQVIEPEFEPPDILGFVLTARNHEIAKDVAAVSRQAERLRHAQDQIGCAHLPLICEMWWRRKIRGFAPRFALRYPFRKQADLVLREASVAGEVAIPRFRRPRRHITTLRHRHNLRRVPRCILKGGEWKRSAPAVMMARRAVRKNYRRYIFAECNRQQKQPG